MKLFYLILALAMLLVGRAPMATTLGQSQLASTDTVHNRLTASHHTVQAGQTFQIAWDIVLDNHWHVYWQNPGDSGLPPRLIPQTEGFTVGDTAWPVPTVIEVLPIITYGYENRVVLLTNVTAPANLASGPFTLPVRLEYLYCKDVCLPGKVDVSLPLIIAPKAVPNPLFQPLQAFHTTNLPTPLATPATFSQQNGALWLTLPNAPAMPAPRFIPTEEGWLDDAALQPTHTQNGTLHLQLTPDSFSNAPIPNPLTGLVLNGTGQGYIIQAQPTPTPPPALPSHIPPTSPDTTTTSATLPVAMLLAFMSGLLLNLMPCVLPVIALKVFGLINTPSAAGRLAHTMAYTGGILTTLAGLAGVVAVLQHSGAQIGWGFQLQNPLFVAGLTALMTLLALNFWGVFSVGESLSRLGQHGQNQGHTGAFLTGLLAVLVATPCTVPFMGGAMAYALSQPFGTALPVFLALGFGMAAPLVLVALFPPLAYVLPKPGAWMTTFKHAMGWPLLATALWLAWVFGKQTNMDSLAILLAGLTALGVGVWLVGLTYKRIGLLLAIAAVLTTGALLMPAPSTAHTTWQPWNKQAEIEARQRGPVFVNFTADWCITCKATEAAVLARPATQAMFKQHHVTLFKADWTRYDDAITAELATHNRRGVPLYLAYRQGELSPIILPQLLTLGILEDVFTP